MVLVIDLSQGERKDIVIDRIRYSLRNKNVTVTELNYHCTKRGRTVMVGLDTSTNYLKDTDKIIDEFKKLLSDASIIISNVLKLRVRVNMQKQTHALDMFINKVNKENKQRKGYALSLTQVSAMRNVATYILNVPLMHVKEYTELLSYLKENILELDEVNDIGLF